MALTLFLSMLTISGSIESILWLHIQIPNEKSVHLSTDMPDLKSVVNCTVEEWHIAVDSAFNLGTKRVYIQCIELLIEQRAASYILSFLQLAPLYQIIFFGNHLPDYFLGMLWAPSAQSTLRQAIDSVLIQGVKKTAIKIAKFSCKLYVGIVVLLHYLSCY